MLSSVYFLPGNWSVPISYSSLCLSSLFPASSLSRSVGCVRFKGKVKMSFGVRDFPEMSFRGTHNQETRTIWLRSIQLLSLSPCFLCLVSLANERGCFVLWKECRCDPAALSSLGVSRSLVCFLTCWLTPWLLSLPFSSQFPGCLRVESAPWPWPELH